MAIVLPFDATSDSAIQDRVQQTISPLVGAPVLDAVPCSGTYDSCLEIIRGPDPTDPSGFEKLVRVMAAYKVYAFPPIAGDIPFIGPINYPGYIEIVGLSTMRWE